MALPKNTKNTIISVLSEIARDRNSEDLLPHQRKMTEAVAEHLARRNGSKIYEKEGNIPEAYRETATNYKMGDFCQIDTCVSSGKTRVIGKMTKQLIANGIPVLILEPTKLLAQQTQDALIGEMHIDKGDIGMFNGNVPAGAKSRAVKKPVLIATPDSLNRLYTSKGFSKTPGGTGYRPFVIVDETHERVQGPLLSQHIEALKTHSAVVGLTGTDAGAHQTLYDGQVPVYTLPLVEAIETGISTMVNHAKARVVDVRIDDAWYKQSLQERASIDKEGNIRKEMHDFLARNSALISATNQVHFNYKDAHLGPIHRLPTLVYVYRTDAAKAGAQQANKIAKEKGIEGFHAEYISGKMKKEEIDNILRRFAAGEINMLWNDRLIGLGYNERNVAVVHDLRNNSVEQQFGRALRAQGEDYNMRYGDDKVALGISYRALTPEGDFVPTYTTVDVLGGEPERYDHVRFPTTPRERFPRQPRERFPSLPELPDGSLPSDAQISTSDGGAISSSDIHPSLPPDEHLSSPPHEFFPPRERFSSKEYDYMDGIVIHATTKQTREVANAIKRKRDEMMGKAPENWMTMGEAEKLTDIDKQRWLEVVKHIKPDQTYTPQGFPPKAAGEPVVFGSELARKGARGWILHTSLVEGVQAFEATKAEIGRDTVNGYARKSDVKPLELKKALGALRDGRSTKVGDLSSEQRAEIESDMPQSRTREI